MRYLVTVPPTREQGSYKTTVSSGRYETAAQQALADYNSARAHDGLPPVKRMPNGTRYARTYLTRPRNPLVTIHDPRFPAMPHFGNLP